MTVCGCFVCGCVAKVVFVKRAVNHVTVFLLVLTPNLILVCLQLCGAVNLLDKLCMTMDGRCCLIKVEFLSIFYRFVMVV